MSNDSESKMFILQYTHYYINMIEYLIQMAIAAKDAAPIIASIAALIAVFIGPHIQQKIARSQQISSVVSNNRVRWIEEFRKEVADFCASCQLYEAQKSYLKTAAEEENDKAQHHYEVEIDKTLLSTNKILNSLRLKLNVEKSVEREIMDSILRIDRLELNDDYELFHAELNAEIDVLSGLTKKFLKAEWEKVERLE